MFPCLVGLRNWYKKQYVLHTSLQQEHNKQLSSTYEGLTARYVSWNVFISRETLIMVASRKTQWKLWWLCKSVFITTGDFDWVRILADSHPPIPSQTSFFYNRLHSESETRRHRERFCSFYGVNVRCGTYTYVHAYRIPFCHNVFVQCHIHITRLLELIFIYVFACRCSC